MIRRASLAAAFALCLFACRGPAPDEPGTTPAALGPHPVDERGGLVHDFMLTSKGESRCWYCDVLEPGAKR